MPRLNRSGEYLGGVGGGGGNLHITIGNDAHGNVRQIGHDVRAAIASAVGIPNDGEGSGWFWKDDRTIAGQLCGVPASVSPNFCATFSYDVLTGSVQGPYGHGANDGRGRGGTAAWWLGGSGVYTSGGYRNAQAAIADVFEDGSFVIVKDQQQQTLGLQQIASNGTVLRDIPTEGQVSGIFAREGIVLWFDFGPRQARAFGASHPVPAGSFVGSGPFASDRSGRLWIVDSSQGLLLRAWDKPVGYWLSRDGLDFFPDVVKFGDGLRIVSSMNQGETPGTTRVYDFDPTTGVLLRNGAPEHLTLINLGDSTPIDPGTIGSPEHVRTKIAKSVDADVIFAAMAAGLLIYVAYDRGD